VYGVSGSLPEREDKLSDTNIHLGQIISDRLYLFLILTVTSSDKEARGGWWTHHVSRSTNSLTLGIVIDRECKLIICRQFRVQEGRIEL
jgi:hypothetical protein